MNVSKAYEITDAKITFVSLVDKAANLKKFLITKAEAGKATFSTYGRIVKTDADSHFVTGIVYEPLTEDAHGNFMTEKEITKTAYSFIKNGGSADLQHSFKPLEGAAVVESWIAKADFQCGDETVQKGTWLMTMEITEPKIWEAIEKGEITGFSMGGIGVYSDKDVNLDNVSKSTEDVKNEPEQSEKKGVFKKLAELLGFDVVEKGELADSFSEKQRANSFWTAFYALEDLLCHWDSWSGREVLESDEAKIKEALSDFSTIVEGILTSKTPITKQLAAADKPVEKSGKKMSGANRETLQTAYDALGVLLEAVSDVKEDEEEKAEDGTKPDEGGENNKEDTEVTKAEVEKLLQDTVADTVANAVEKALGEQQKEEPKQPDEAITKEMVQEMVTQAVTKAIEPVLKARGIPSALNDGTGGEQPVEKHYLYGIL